MTISATPKVTNEIHFNFLATIQRRKILSFVAPGGVCFSNCVERVLAVVDLDPGKGTPQVIGRLGQPDGHQGILCTSYSDDNSQPVRHWS